MKLEQWQHIRNSVKEQLNAVGSDLKEMESTGNSYDEVISNYPRYDEAVKLFVDYAEIVNHMDTVLTVQEVEQIDY